MSHKSNNQITDISFSPVEKSCRRGDKRNLGNWKNREYVPDIR